MDLIEIVQDDFGEDGEAEGSDMDGDNLIDEFDDENEEENDALEAENVPNVVGNDALREAGQAAQGAPAGGPAQQWTDNLTAVPDHAFTGKISLLVRYYVLCCHTICLEYVFSLFCFIMYFVLAQLCRIHP